MSQRCRGENWKSKGRMAVGRKGMERRGTASDYWEDKDPAVLGLTAPSTSGAPHPSLHPSLSSPSNSIQTREFPPPHHPPIIHLSLHSSLFSPTNGNNNTQQHNNQQFAVPPFSNLTSKLSSSGWRVFWSVLSSRSQWGKEILLNHAKNVTGRFWCGLAILSASEFRTVQANSRDACVNASIQCRRQSWFCITLDYSDTLRQPADSQ